MLSREWRCSWSSSDRRCSNYIWVIDNFIAYQGTSYIRGFTAGQYHDYWCPGCRVRQVISNRVLTLQDKKVLVSHTEGFQLNSLWPSDTIWQHRFGSALAQVMACCLTAPSHYLNQCWLTISKIQWHPSESNFTRDTSGISLWHWLENCLFKILLKSPRGQWVNLHLSDTKVILNR